MTYIIIIYSYYGVVDTTPEALTQFLVEVVDNCIQELVLSGCITINEVYLFSIKFCKFFKTKFFFED